MNKNIVLFTALLLCFINFSFANEKNILPKNLKWITNENDPVWSSKEAIKGGEFRLFLLSFPLTLRNVGPDANGSFRMFLDYNRLALIQIHPNTNRPIPALATHWAYDKDQKTIFYKLNKDAKWSDGKPVTADDFLYTLEFMRSPHIVAPWYNNYYSEIYDRVIKYDDYTIAVVSKIKKSKYELHIDCNLEPTPAHFYKTLTNNFINDFNWTVAPNTGPYNISEVEKGQYITFKRVQNWWGENLKYNKHRYNFNTVKMVVIRDQNVAYEHFKKGELSSFPSTLPEHWHEKVQGDLYQNGMIDKYWLYHAGPNAMQGIWINSSLPLLNDLNIRKGIAHSLNIEKVISSVLRGDYERLLNVTDGYGEFTNKKIVPLSFNPEKAIEYFKKAGWDKLNSNGIRINKDNTPLSFNITLGLAHHLPRLLVLKEEAKKSGLELNINQMDSSAAFKSVREKQHQLAWQIWTINELPRYWEYFHSTNANKPQTNNITNLVNKKLDKLIELYDAELSEAKKTKLAHQIQQIIHDEVVFIPTFKIPYFRFALWNYYHLPKVPNTRLATEFEELIMGPKGATMWYDEKQFNKTTKMLKNGEKLPQKIIIDKTYR